MFGVEKSFSGDGLSFSRMSYFRGPSLLLWRLCVNFPSSVVSKALCIALVSLILALSGQGAAYADTPDTTPPDATTTMITVYDITPDNIVNEAESLGMVDIMGLVEGEFRSGDTVTLTIGGQMFTGPVDASGAFTISVEGSWLLSDADSGVEASVAASDEAGNVNTTGEISTTKYYFVNRSPTANAGPDAQVGPARTITLDGSGSSDPEGDDLLYSWSQTGGPTVTLSDPSAVAPTFTSPTLNASDSPIQLTFILFVTDPADNQSEPDTVIITVNPPENQAPVADAGPDAAVASGASVALDGSASSDPDGHTPLTYAWSQTGGTTVTLSDASVVAPTFTAPTLDASDTAEQLTFSLIVTDSLGRQSTADTVIITVNPPENEAPVADAGPDASVASAASVALDGSASSDPDGHTPLTYAWSQTGGPAVTLSDATVVAPTFTAPTLGAGDAAEQLTFSLIVTDSLGLQSAADTVTITVNPPDNQAPVANAGPDASAASGASVSLDGSASSDPDGHTPLTYAWSQTGGPAVTLSDASVVAPTFTAPTLGAGDAAVQLTFSLVVTDSLGLQSAADTVTITVSPPDNQAPVANAGPDATVASGASVSLDGSGSSDPDGHTPLTYAWSQTGGPTVTLSDASAVAPTFTAPTLGVGDAAEQLTFSLIVTDSIGLQSVADTVTITVSPQGDTTPPSVVISDGPQTFSGTDPFTVTVTFSEDVQGFDDLINDITVSNGSVAMITGGPGVYTLTIQPTGGGDVSIQVPSGAASDSAGNLNTASNVFVVVSSVVEETKKQIAEFMLSRANKLATSQPRLIRFLQGSGCGAFDLRSSEDSGSLEGCVTKDHVWAEISSTWSGGNSYLLATLGAHEFINPDLILGGMLQYDDIDEGNASGHGWMIGPYFAAKHPDHPLFFEGRLLYGKTSNSISPFGTYTDSFDTERWLAQLRTEGEIVRDTVTWKPLLDVTYTEDHQLSYSDSLGNSIDGQTVSLLQLSAGVDFKAPLQADNGKLMLTGGASVIYSKTSGRDADFDGGRGRVHLGLDYADDDGSNFLIGGFYDGIGSDYEGYGVQLRYEHRF